MATAEGMYCLSSGLIHIMIPQKEESSIEALKVAANLGRDNCGRTS